VQTCKAFVNSSKVVAVEALSFIDLYCERTAPRSWNEPVNALSNAAFLLAALLASLRLQRRSQNLLM